MSNFHAGQRCMIVQSEAGNLGRVVTLVRFVGLPDSEYKYDRYWEIEEFINLNIGGLNNYAYEGQLMPLDEAQTNNACTQTQGSLPDLEEVFTPQPLSTSQAESKSALRW